ncbi:MAG: hypothetical protein HFF08_09655 [Oscillospiraceae bacterium]|nr:hypothetical protein [Oscillospiraceae bacterium]
MELIAPYEEYDTDSALAVNFYYREYRKQKGIAAEPILRKLLQAAVGQKDFITVSRIYQENSEKYDKGSLLEETWNRVKRLLQMIQEQIGLRKQREIFMFFADALQGKTVSEIHRG